jgi:prepilin peptidase CpaA
LTILDALVVLVSSLSIFFDLKIRKIPNWLIAVGATSGIVLSGCQGLYPLYQSVAGFVVGVAVLILPFGLGWIGAGDVKFFGVIGALLGVSWLPRIFFYSALAAGLIAGLYIFTGSSRLGSIKELWTDLKLGVLSLGRVMPEPVAARNREGGQSVPWGVAFAVGTIIAYYFDYTGQWAGF